MSTRNEHQKASDVFRESEFVFGQKVSFTEAFPQIADIKIEVKRSGRGVDEWNKISSYEMKRLPGEYIDCTNPLCYNGGFSIGSILRDMVGNKLTEKTENAICQGNEGSLKGRRVYRRCLNFFQIKVSIEYKNEEATEANSNIQ